MQLFGSQLGKVTYSYSIPCGYIDSSFATKILCGRRGTEEIGRHRRSFLYELDDDDSNQMLHRLLIKKKG